MVTCELPGRQLRKNPTSAQSCPARELPGRQLRKANGGTEMSRVGELPGRQLRNWISCWIAASDA